MHLMKNVGMTSYVKALMSVHRYKSICRFRELLRIQISEYFDLSWSISQKKLSGAYMLLAVTLAGTARVALAQASGQAKVWQGTVTLPTYEEGAPDLNPPFDSWATTEFNYPYTMRTSLTGVKKNEVWRAIFLENEYLKCTVLPDLGGHLYNCTDKINGQSMFYANPSIKKAEIGHRGAWAAFGVEYNFPVSHNWASLSPVDFAYSAQSDGSASVTVGNIDRPYGMQWNVDLTLRPGSTLLEEKVTLYNRSDVRHRFYWWDNAGVQVWDDSSIEYPMRFAAAHGFTDVYQWPVLAPGGKDVSLLRNQTEGPVSYFSHATRETFMGIWNPKTQAGTAQFSEFQDLPSKKIWSWGSDPAGLAWRTALSDNQSSYVEVQAGLFRNQETYAFLDPGQTILFREYWMPLRGIGGISRANKAAILKLEVHGSNVFTSLNVNSAILGANIAIKQGTALVWSGTANLRPEVTWSNTAFIQEKAPKVSFELKDSQGKLLLTQTDGEYDWDSVSSVKTGPQQTYSPPVPSARSEDDWLQVGRDQELNGQVLLAIDTYERALQRYPQSFSLEVAAGRLAASLQRFAEAEPLLKAAQARDTPNALVAYYLGITEEGLGQLREAETTFDISYRQASLRAPAAQRLAELRARNGELQKAYLFAKAAAEAEPLDFKAQEQVEALARAGAEASKAGDLVQSGLALDPTSDFLKNEVGQPDLPHLAADPYRVLRVAAEYMELGLYQRASQMLETTYPEVPINQSEPGSVLPQFHPLVAYYAAYCKAKLGMDAGKSWRAASQLSPSLIFPSTEMDHLVLNAALSENSEDATAQYFLGTLLFAKGLYNEGIAHWTEAQRLSPRLPVVAVDLGTAWLERKRDPSRALEWFQQGLENDPYNPRVYMGLDEAMSLTDMSPPERAAALSRYPQADLPQSKMPANLVYQLALTRAEAGQFASAEALFQGRFFPSEEGGISSDQVLFEILLMQAEADAKLANSKSADDLLRGRLAGLSMDGASSQGYFRMAQVARACRQHEMEQQLLTKAAAGRTFADNVWASRAQKALGIYDVQRTTTAFERALPALGSPAELSTYTSYHWYGIGMMQAALGWQEQAAQSFHNALLLRDEWMSHHLSRAALAALSNPQ